MADRFVRIDITDSITDREDLLLAAGGVFTSGIGIPNVASATTDTRPYYLGMSGWRGLEGPSADVNFAESVSGYGGEVISWRPRPRTVTIPIMRPANRSKDLLDRIIYSSNPLTISFIYPNAASLNPRVLLACRVVSEQEVRNRHHGVWQHNITFRSSWPYFVEYSQALHSAVSSVPSPTASPGPHIVGLTTRTSRSFATHSVSWGGVTSIFTTLPLVRTAFWCPSPPFQHNIAGTQGVLKPYLHTGESIASNITVGSGTITWRGFYLRNWAGV